MASLAILAAPRSNALSQRCRLTPHALRSRVLLQLAGLRGARPARGAAGGGARGRADRHQHGLARGWRRLALV